MKRMDKLLHLIFPPKCIFCNKILAITSDIDICKECYEKIPFLSPHPISGGRNLFNNRYCDQVVCVCEYSGNIKEALIRFKFYNKPSFYRALGKLLYSRLEDALDVGGIDMVLSVPLSRKRYAQRGYNQARLVSKVLSRELRVADCSAIIKRVRDTRSQRLLDKKSRYRNIRDAFALIDPDIVEGKTIVLVDDIYTTGNTVGECARILKEAGADRVIAGVIASGRKY